MRQVTQQSGPRYSIHKFRQEVQGTIPDHDGTLGIDYDECVDGANTWAWVIGIEQHVGNANELDYSADCDWVANEPTNFPVPGDIVVWTGWPADVRYGHIAEALWGCSEFRLRTLDVNWPDGSGYRVNIHSYEGVKGWWHPRKIGPEGARY
jgi:hypothetical protein